MWKIGFCEIIKLVIYEGESSSQCIVNWIMNLGLMDLEQVVELSVWVP